MTVRLKRSSPMEGVATSKDGVFKDIRRSYS